MAVIPGRKFRQMYAPINIQTAIVRRSRNTVCLLFESAEYWLFIKSLETSFLLSIEVFSTLIEKEVASPVLFDPAHRNII